MIKLLKYDWKRNASVILAALVILLLIQVAFTTAGWLKDWDVDFISVISILLYAMSAFLAFLMACQTFNYNIKAYSRRLLPLPTLYTIIAPIILLFLIQLVIALIFVAHASIIEMIFGEEKTMHLFDLNYFAFMELASIAVSYGWGTLITTLMIFLSITLSKTVEGRGGTFLGIVVCLAMFIAMPYMAWLIFPDSVNSTQYLGFLTLELTEAADGTMTWDVTPFDGVRWLVLLFEGAVMTALIYGTVFLMNRKIKL
ncbi:hypothetical protein [Paenibacillus sp. L3-i20]|uniref:hypothetical protein n=1 Tax=Paenibacillus sp. L3-i20 TaxID=2905833 RepID=UPI001EE0D5F6|nr:hypothetical protein [Paenibacillus sp. L3-i20]GKU78239.1 hypothetical protein L3i20_v226360 [Paenibacillus sp. L3-i20]